MAIDTELKRLSAIHAGCPWRRLFPIPDGSIAAVDRPVIAKLYATVNPTLKPNPCNVVTVRSGEIIVPARGDSVKVWC